MARRAAAAEPSADPNQQAPNNDRDVVTHSRELACGRGRAGHQRGRNRS